MTLPKIPMLAVLILLSALSATARSKAKQDPEQLRANYIARLQQATVPAPDLRALGSLWSPNGPMANLAADYKARSLNDSIIIQVAVHTSAQASDNLTSQRTFQTQSAISGAAGSISTRGVNPLLSAQSATQLKGQGQTAANSSLQTSLTGQVIAVLANGNLVVEAQREIAMNHQREWMIVRGVVRPGDISADNTVPSAALGNLEIELKGKGVLSDSTRPPNPLTRAILWLFGF